MEQRPVKPRVLQCLGAFADGFQRGHEAERRARAEWIELREPTPPVGGRPVLAALAGCAGQRLEGVAHQLGESRPLALHPPTEIALTVQVEAVEKRPPIEGDRACRVVLVQRAFE